MKVVNKIIMQLVVTAAVALYLSIAFPGPLFAGGKVRVLTTTSDLKSIVGFIGGDIVKVDSLSRGTQDAHFVEAKPSYMIKARKADLFIRIGMELEIGYESLILEGSRNPRIQIGRRGHLDVSSGITPLEVPIGSIDRSLGDVHSQGNPHYWLDPLNAIIMANHIADRLEQLSPENGKFFRENVLAFEKKIYASLFGEELIKKVGGRELASLARENRLELFLEGKELINILGGWLKEMAPFKGRKIVTYHKSWPYLTHRFGLVIANELEPKPGISPGPGHINMLIRQMKDEEVKVILMEPFYSERPARLVAERTDAKIVKVANSVGGSKEAKDYFSLINSIVENLRNALAS